MKSYDPQPLLLKRLVYLLMGLGACLLIASLWLTKEQEPAGAGWLPLQAELAAALADPDEPEMPAGSVQPAAVPTPVAQGLTDGAAAEAAGNAGGAGDAGSSAVEADVSLQPANDGRIDLNRATAEQLVTLPGIGPAKAQAIIEDRTKNGLFRSIEDITRVRGIGSKMLEKIKESIVVKP